MKMGCFVAIEWYVDVLSSGEFCVLKKGFCRLQKYFWCFYEVFVKITNGKARI